MKKSVIIIIIIMLSLLVGCSQREVEASELQNRNGIYYVVNEEEPFTGKYVNHYDNGQVKVDGGFKEGLRQGEFIFYYENGQVKSNENYKDGKLHGEGIKYYEDGQVELDLNYKDGKLHGEYIEYYTSENSNLGPEGIEMKFIYEDGEIVKEIIKSGLRVD